MGVGLIAVKEGKRVEKIYPITTDAKGRQTIAVGKDYKNSTVSKILLYCNQGTAIFSNTRLSTPVDQKGLFAFKNVITAPHDAKIAVDGIEVTRDRNEGLNDVIRGVVLNIKRASQHEVDLQIDHNTDASAEKVKKFVDSYNRYLDYHRELTKAAKGEKPGDYMKTLSQSGLFVGDMTLLRLENTLRMTINGAYQSSADKPIKVLSQIGVSTGAINAEWESIKTGRLVIDENLLKKTITENPEGVAMFFGSDTDGDNRTDNGMAYRVVFVLKPYVQIGKNIISTKIDFEDSSIKLADDNIKKKEDHLKKYEETLKRKFARMDRAISESNSKKQWMKYQMEGVSGHNQVETKKEK
jgi:flagellar hook-associated protein 2